jgi:hypothetical protein
MKTKFVALLIVLGLTAPLAAQQVTLTDDVRALLQQIVNSGIEAQRLLTLYPPPPPPPPPDPWDSAPVMTDSAALTAALAANTPLIKLDPAVAYEAARFTVPSGTSIRCYGARVRGTSGPAFYVPPGASNVLIEGAIASASYSSVIAVGDNATTDLALVPDNITLTNVSVPTHRGKRAFEIHGKNVVINNPFVDDTFEPAGFDSQGIWINNTPGPVTVNGGIISAGSENIMVGGAATGIAGLIPADLLFDGVTLYRPLSWRTDGIRRYVKNLFELKTGERVTVRNVIKDGNWTDAGQQAYAVQITPRNGGGIRDILFENVTIRNTGGGFNILGDNSVEPYAPFKTTGIRVVNSNILASKTDFGGFGYLAMLTGGPGTLEITGTRFVGDNYYGVTTTVGDQKVVQSIRLLNNQIMAPYYTSVILPISTPGSNGLDTWVMDYAVTGNRIANSSSACRTKFPDNTYVTAAEF